MLGIGANHGHRLMTLTVWLAWYIMEAHDLGRPTAADNCGITLRLGG